jgi:tryptophan-rich sensory protein
MKLKLNYFIIPVITILVSLIGNYFTSIGLKDWYQGLALPSFTPPGFVIGIVWTVIFILATISALYVWPRFNCKPLKWQLAGIFILNALLNVFWSFLFFVDNQLAAAIWEMIALNLTTLILILLIWPKSKFAASLLIPYFGWVTFATYLAYRIYALN